MNNISEKILKKPKRMSWLELNMLRPFMFISFIHIIQVV